MPSFSWLRTQRDDRPQNSVGHLQSTPIVVQRPPRPPSIPLTFPPSTPTSQPAGSIVNPEDTIQHHASLCSSCRLPMSGQFVRALGTRYHLDCFRCQDCNIIVASKFFPAKGPEGQLQPLCERDYFGRSGLLCNTCGMALRGSYITACNKKFHVEHFTCSVCPTLFGPQDSYFEHQNDIYCPYHYSTRFATKCVGCNSAILDQFVETNRNSRDECWHPECNMIHKFWKVKVAPRPLSISPSTDEAPYAPEEAEQTPASLKEGQARIEQKVYNIWTNLSSFEESCTACISEMLRHASNGLYLEAIHMAEKFVLHVEVLFAAIDELETGFARVEAKGMSHIRNARLLCRSTVDLLTLLSRPQNPNNSSPNDKPLGMTQELVKGLAYRLKNLIRIALIGALELEREHNSLDGLTAFLDHLHYLALDGGDPQARRVRGGASAMVLNDGSTSIGAFVVSGTTAVSLSTAGKGGLAYGYKSLYPENAGDSPFSPIVIAALNSGVSMIPPTDLCTSCGLAVEEDCVRLGTDQRWHSQCVKCITCGKVAAVSSTTSEGTNTKIDLERNKAKDGSASTSVKLSSARRDPANVDEFCYHTTTSEITHHNPSASAKSSQITISCTTHAHSESQQGFIAVSRLEQYAFLLNVALRRLFFLLWKQGAMPLSSRPDHNLKSPIQTALTSAPKLEREDSNPDDPTASLDHLHCLSLGGGDPQSHGVRNDVSARVLNDVPTLLKVSVVSGATVTSLSSAEKGGHAYGYKSFSPENVGHSSFSPTVAAAFNSGVSMMLPGDLCLPCDHKGDTVTSQSAESTAMSFMTQEEDEVALATASIPPSSDITGNVSLAHSKRIGLGGFGDLFLGNHTDRGKVALKRPHRLFDETSIRRFLREVDLWRSISHPHVLPCLGICKIEPDIYVVSPFIKNGDLFSCMDRGVRLNCSKLLYEVAEALSHLHHKGIVHGDVKARNILLSDDGSALLCDFGLAKAFDTMVTSTESKGAGSVRWMAPELFLGESRSMASDVYSLGITIAEVLSGRAPYHTMSENLAVLHHVIYNNGRPMKDPLSSPEGKSYAPLWETAEKCWVKDVKVRPYMVEVLGMLFPLSREMLN